MKKLLALLLLLSSQAYADEVITGFDANKDLPILNEELRKLNDEIKSVRDSITTYTPTASNALSGSVVKVVMSQDSSVDTSSTGMVFDDTVPTSSEGEEYTQLAVTITPSSASNILYIDLDLYAMHNSGGGGETMAAIFQDSGAAAIATGYITQATSWNEPMIRLRYKMTAGTTSATTFKVRYGHDGGGNVYTNGSSTGGGYFGGTLYSSLKVVEVKA
jgi:hypothetical protein